MSYQFLEDQTKSDSKVHIFLLFVALPPHFSAPQLLFFVRVKSIICIFHLFFVFFKFFFCNHYFFACW